MKDLYEAFFVLDIKIHRDRSSGMFGLSQNIYIDRVFKRFDMCSFPPWDAPLVKWDKFSKAHFLKNDLQKEGIKQIPMHLK